MRALPAGRPACRLALLRPPAAGEPWAFVTPQPLYRASLAEVEAWFSSTFLAPLQPDRVVLRERIDAWHAEAAARSLAPTATTWLSALPAVLPISLVRREREGGRRYAYYLPGYRGPSVVSEREFRRLRGPRVLLPSIPRRVRGAFPAPRGWRYVSIDIDRCFLVLLATVSDDDDLLAAAAGDLHQEAGDVMAPSLPPKERRQVGKLFNNAVVGLVSAEGLHVAMRRAGMRTTLEEACAQHRRWWSQFSRARELRDQWAAHQRRAAVAGSPVRISYPDGRTYSFDAATVRGIAPRPRWAHLRTPTNRLDAAIRTTFSALWRGVEGALLDRCVQRLFPLRSRGLRLVLPIYDGLLLQVPAHDAEPLAVAAHDAVMQALADLGVPATASMDIRSTWAASP